MHWLSLSVVSIDGDNLSLEDRAFGPVLLSFFFKPSQGISSERESPTVVGSLR